MRMLMRYENPSIVDRVMHIGARDMVLLGGRAYL